MRSRRAGGDLRVTDGPDSVVLETGGMDVPDIGKMDVAGVRFYSVQSAVLLTAESMLNYVLI